MKRMSLFIALGVMTLMSCGDKVRIVEVPAPVVPAPAVPEDTSYLKRAYIVNALSSNMTVIDLVNPATATILATLSTASTPHMAAVSQDGKKVYASGTLGNAISIFDAKTLTHIKDLPVAPEPTHMSASPDNKYMAVCNEGTNEVTFIDVATDQIAGVVGGLLTPHWVAFRPDSQRAYIANINGQRITIVNMATLMVTGHIFLTGKTDADVPSAEGGFAECFMDSAGILYAAHGDSGKVMLVNTTTNTWVKEIAVGTDPWVAYVSPWGGTKVLVANQGSMDTTIIDTTTQSVVATVGTNGYDVYDEYTGQVVRVTTPESEVYGINFACFGQKAYAGMRTNGAIQRIDLLTNNATAVFSLTEGLPAPGFTQPAATTPDQRYIVFTVTSTSDWGDPGASGPVNRIVIWDSWADQAVRTFDNVGIFPWSATIPDGQDYCH